MTKYIKTATIEAEQFNETKEQQFKFGITDKASLTSVESVAYGADRYTIQTPEGDMIVVHPTDWIATGVKGDHWPIKDEIFKRTYKRLVEDIDRRYRDAPEETSKQEPCKYCGDNYGTPWHGDDSSIFRYGHDTEGNPILDIDIDGSSRKYLITDAKYCLWCGRKLGEIDGYEVVDHE